ncbi:MAG: GNAT family protein [Deinococcota bacterium]
MTFQLRVDDELSLVLLEPHLAEELYTLVDANRDHLRAWLPWVDAQTSAEDSKAFILNSLQVFARREGVSTGMLYKGQLVGTLGSHDHDNNVKSAEIGYWINREFQGQGIVSRGCKALCRYLFEVRDLNRLMIRCATGNAKSCAIPERLGFIREGVLRQCAVGLGDAPSAPEILYDMVIYGLLRAEYDALPWARVKVSS